MARTVAALPAGSRITDYISLGVIAKYFPLDKIRETLQQTKRASVRQRDWPAHVVVYYVIALALYMRSSYREVLRCLLAVFLRNGQLYVRYNIACGQPGMRLTAFAPGLFYTAAGVPVSFHKGGIMFGRIASVKAA